MSDDFPLGSSRRDFLRTTGTTAAATVVSSILPINAYGSELQNAAHVEPTDAPPIEGDVSVNLRINGEDQRLRVDPRTTLLDCIRERVVLTGTKKGCDHGQCGACTVHVNGRRVV